MAFSEEKVDFGDKPDALAKHPLTQFGLAGYSDLIKVNVGISKKIIGLGASAPTYYPAVGAELNCEVIYLNMPAWQMLSVLLLGRLL